MEVSRAAVGVLAAVCVAAGAAGTYVVSGGNDPLPPTEVAAAPDVGQDPAAAAVEQSEVIVDIAPEAPPAAPLEATRPAPPRAPARREPVAPPASEPPELLVEPTEVVPTEFERELVAAVPLALEPAPIVDPEPLPLFEPLAPLFEELVIGEGTVIGLQVESFMSSEQARVEDEVVARVTRDVRVGDRVAIPSGARAHGEVTLVERSGRLRERARLGIRFTSVVLADGTHIPLVTDPIYREGEAPGSESATKIGGSAIGGAIIGGILGGAKGAAIGGSIGAGARTAAALAGGRHPATLPAGTPVTIRIIRPTTVTVEN